MNTYEQLLYLLRIPFILLVVIVVVTIFFYSTPTLNDAKTEIQGEKGISPMRADLYSAAVAHHDLLYAAPGVIDEQAFTQATADKLLKYNNPTPILYVVRAELINQTGASITGNITYNQQAWRVLEHTQQFRGTRTLTKELPVTVKRSNGEHEQAILILRSYYEP